MTTPFFSNSNREFHLGPFPMERLARLDMDREQDRSVALGQVPRFEPVSMDVRAASHSVVNAIAEYQAMLDAIRDGIVNKQQAHCPEDPEERARHLKSFAYFQDAPMAGIARLQPDMRLDQTIRNPEIDRLSETLQTRQCCLC